MIDWLLRLLILGRMVMNGISEVDVPSSSKSHIRWFYRNPTRTLFADALKRTPDLRIANGLNRTLHSFWLTSYEISKQRLEFAHTRCASPGRYGLYAAIQTRLAHVCGLC